MTTLPMVERELRQEARRPLTWRLRWTVACILLCVWYSLQLIFTHTNVPPQARGATLFRVMAGVVLLIASMAGPLTAADCVSREKRDGTLGLLFLTDLRPLDVVLGKLASRLMTCLFAIFSSVPVIAMALLMGGVTGQMVFRVLVAWLDVLFLSLAIAMFVSSLVESERKAMMTTLFALGSAIVLPVVFLAYRVIVREVQPDPVSVAAILSLSPWSPMLVAIAPAIPMSPRLLSGFFWGAIAMHQTVAVCLLLASGWLLKRSWQTGTGRWADRVGQWRQWWLYGPAARRIRWRHLWLNRNPMAWRSLREVRKPMLVWFLLIGMSFGFAWGWSRSGQAIFNADILVTWMFITFGLLKLWIASEASRQLAEDRPLGTLELLLSTPLSLTELARGQKLALMRQFAAPLMVAMGIHGLAIIVATGMNDTYISMFTGIFLVLPVDVWALTWVGLWAALRTPSVNKAIMFCVGSVMALPWFIFYLGALVLVAIEAMRETRLGAILYHLVDSIISRVEARHWPLMLAAASIVWSIFLGRYCKRRFLTDARRVAGEGAPERTRWQLSKIFGKTQNQTN